MTPAPLYVAGVSRSGTTVMAAALDAHPAIHMGYELIPPADLNVAALTEALAAPEMATAAWPRKVGNLVAAKLGSHTGQFVKRTARAGATLESLRDALRPHRSAATPLGIAERLDIAGDIVAAHAAEGVTHTGHKAQGPYLRLGLSRRDDARAVVMIRDPRAVVASQLRTGMAADPDVVARRWLSALDDADAAEGRVRAVRYEDLVADPERALRDVLDWLGVPFSAVVVDFHRQPVGVLVDGQRHANDAMLRRGFVDDRVASWHEELTDEQAVAISRTCGGAMARFGYGPNARNRQTTGDPR